MTVPVIVVVGSLIVGLLANLFVHERVIAVTNRKGLDPYYIHPTSANAFAPAATLLALFIAFVLFGASGSYSSAQTAVQTEAAVVDNFFETAEYLPDPQRQHLQRAAVCYARAVAGPEWASMAQGTGELSPVPSNWTGTKHNGIRHTLLAVGPDSRLFTALTAADQKRGDARRNRLTQSRPKIAGLVSIFMLVGIAMMIIFFALVSPRRSVAHMSATAIAALTLVAALFLIHSLDRPFAGPLAIKSTEMRTTADQDGHDFIARYGASQLGCDANGNPVRSRSS
jgi:hypothetical protein